VGAAVPLSVNEYQPNGGDAMWLGSKGRLAYGLFASKTVLPYLSTLENAICI